MKQFTEEQAKKIAASGVWKKWSHEQVFKFQMWQKLLCMDFGRFHEATEKVLDRPVWTHEFANPERLKREYLGEMDAPTFQQILEMIPEEKRIIVIKE